MKRRPRKVVLTKAQLDRALILLVDEDQIMVPRCAMTTALYDYAWTVWAGSARGRRSRKNSGNDEVIGRTILKVKK